MSYNFNEIEAKWQKYWSENGTYRAENPDESGTSPGKPYYVLDMFPYPSGAGLHVGHPLGYIASDIITRYKRHKGFNVLHPMGYDSFGLPAEQYAIQTGQHPAVTTQENIARYREQLDQIGFSFDWSREVRTSDPEYYRWTQWIFLQLFDSWYDTGQDKARPISELTDIFEKHGNYNVNAVSDETEFFSANQWKNFSEKEQQEILLKYRLTYLAETEVNWCPGLGTVLANDEIVNGVSERGGFPVERKKMMQWSMRITAYAERLLKGLDQIDWSESLKETQRNWIGRSVGCLIDFKVIEENKKPKEEEKDAWEEAYLNKKAEQQKETPSEAEEILWTYLQNRRLGHFFKHQGVIGDFVVDFLCPEKRLVIEIDKPLFKASEEYIEKRIEVLRRSGFTVMRFDHEDISSNIDGVLENILTQLSKIPSENKYIQVFTTRPDTIFGATFMVLAPEHELVKSITTSKQKKAVEKYIKATSKRSERERMADTKSISGEFTGAYAEHPFTKEPIPIWISDYVLAGYGTGAIMSVPAGDDRDYRFAKHFEIPIKNIFEGIDVSEEPFMDKGETKLMNSGFLDGLNYEKAVDKANKKLAELGLGLPQVNYRLRNAVFSRQRYWGEPFPIYYKNDIPTPIPEDCLPLRLPEVEKYLPTKEGHPPLGQAKEWYWNEVEKKVVSGRNGFSSVPDTYKIELNTMPGWAGSSWYFFRYMEPGISSPNSKRDTVFASKSALDYWNSVDLYIGGSEHATGHLLYARFWTMFLKDRGYISINEPFKKLINQGMILGESALAYRISGKNTFISANLIKDEKVDPIHADVSMVNLHNELDIEAFKQWQPDFKKAKFITDDKGRFTVAREVEKMSKSKYNVVNPDDICKEYGADSLRLYEMFLGPLEQAKPWSTSGLSGVHGFLRKLWKLYHSEYSAEKGEDIFYVSEDKADNEALKILHQTIKKITEDTESFSFNTAVSGLMICVNELTKLNCHQREVLEPLAVLVAPYAPHIAEELWNKLGHSESIARAPYPEFDEKMVVETSKNYPISFNGKKRFTMDLPLGLSQQEIEKIVMEDERTQSQLQGRTPKKIIIIPGKIVNIVG